MANYDYDLYGNMISMPHLVSLDWNFLDQLKMVDLGGGGRSYYVYGAGGQRMRKVIERNGTTRIERIYLGPVEIYRKWQGKLQELKLERQTVHIADSSGRIAQVNTKTIDVDNSDTSPLNAPVIRYQYTNVLGSAMLETDDSGNPVSYEEYHSYGTTAYRSSKSGVNLSLKRFRYSSKERDDETGFYYFGARYYAPWLGRWTSTDPAGFVDGLNLYVYASNNPINYRDLFGMQAEVPDDEYCLPLPLDTTYSPSTTDPSSESVFTIEWNSDKGRRYESVSELLSEISEATSTNSATATSTGSSDPREQLPAATNIAPLPFTVRASPEEIIRPQSFSNTRPMGTLQLGSGPGKKEALEMITATDPHWMMENIGGEATLQHLAAKKDFPGPEGRLILSRPSGEVVPRSSFSDHPVPFYNGPGSETGLQTILKNENDFAHIQKIIEESLPILADLDVPWAGKVSGSLTLVKATQDANKWVGFSEATLILLEAQSWVVYYIGKLAGPGGKATMLVGKRFAGIFGPAGTMVGFGVESVRAFQSGDEATGTVYALGFAGGAMLLVAAILVLSPIGWVAVGGLILVSFASGWALGLALWGE